MYKKYDFNLLRESLESLNISINADMEDQFADYYDLLLEWNQVMNLTSIVDFREVLEKHFLDSVVLGSYVELAVDKTVIDVGTGAGFPGIPLKIVFPKLRVTLADSLNKRVNFLNVVIDKLELKEITAVHGRAEELARQKMYREQYDLCVSRAVANLSSLSEYCLPFVKEQGYFISYKSGEIEEEVGHASGAIDLLGGKLREVHQFQLPDTEYRRSFVKIEKTGKTPKKYPRKAGTPTKEPLGYGLLK